ncbi:PhzF family phenazine biosynthesis protein [Asaia sp. VD9]|uniref:PhzF family phenazine biosynthesis protein n=1 Tax=Asaia sp. VD9 TaxID=3081235 RepID=UPI0030190A96
MKLAFHMVDVFATGAFNGNPLAVVVGADTVSDAQMAAIANWTNLSETSFLLAPRSDQADYRVRIFTPHSELPFAGHPTLGTAHVWQSLHGAASSERIVQECAAGLISLRQTSEGLAFAAPPRKRSGPASPAELSRALNALRLHPDDILDARWADNGPGWLALRLRSGAQVLAVEPDWGALIGQKLGVVGAWEPAEHPYGAHVEIRAFVGEDPGYEDPVTGSLNASIAQWLIEEGLAPGSYIAAQGTVLGRAGAVSVEKRGETIWVGGRTTTRVTGTIDL